MNFPNYLSRIFKTRKRKNISAGQRKRVPAGRGSAAEGSGVAVGVSQGPKANGKGLGLANKNASCNNAPAALQPVPPKFTIPRKKLDDVTAFLARYLHCSDHQRNLLALWILHSHCFSAAEVTPYLSVQSEKIQSGKTRCLQLLSLLCPNPALTASFAASNLSSRIHYSEQRPTFLLDECQATLGSRGRSKNPILRAILASGFQRGLGHTDRKCERVIFSPKAFAGIGPLPESLAERSIPIRLERLTAPVKVQPLREEAVAAEAQPLREWLALWGSENLQKLKSAPTLELKDFPSGISLTDRRKDMLAPLLHIARLLAGDWPKRAADAFTALFQDQVQRERKHALDLLYELREAFSHHGQPARISTASLLVWLHHQPEAPWNREGLISANRLAEILRPFNIFPRLQRRKGESSHRGYTLQDFLYTWSILLPDEPTLNRNTSRREPMPDPPTQEVSGISANQRKPVPAGRGSAAEDFGVAVDVTQGPKANGQRPVAPCNNATTTSDVSSQQPKVAESAAGRNPSPVSSAPLDVSNYFSAPPPPAANASVQEPTAKSQKPVLVPNPQPIPFPSQKELEAKGYRFGPFSPQYNPLDVEMIAYYAKQGYRPLAPHEVDYAEFRCNGVPFAKASDVPHRPKPPEPPPPQKSAEEAEREATVAWFRQQQQSPPKCAERENIRLAPTKRGY